MFKSVQAEKQLCPLAKVQTFRRKPRTREDKSVHLSQNRVPKIKILNVNVGA